MPIICQYNSITKNSGVAVAPPPPILLESLLLLFELSVYNSFLKMEYESNQFYDSLTANSLYKTDTHTHTRADIVAFIITIIFIIKH